MSRNVWTQDEVKLMIAIIKEKHIVELMDKKKYRTAELFKLVEKEMIEAGYANKNSDQILRKFKALKAEYSKCKKGNSYSGASRKECEFYGELDEMFSSRPCTSTQGIDTSNLMDDKENDIEIHIDSSVLSVDLNNFEEYLHVNLDDNASTSTANPEDKANENNSSERGEKRKIEFDSRRKDSKRMNLFDFCKTQEKLQREYLAEMKEMNKAYFEQESKFEEELLKQNAIQNKSFLKALNKTMKDFRAKPKHHTSSSSSSD